MLNQAEPINRFDGKTYDPLLDGERLVSQFNRVLNLMLDGTWRTLEEIESAIKVSGKKDSEAAISARLRDFRKEEFGGYKVINRRRGNPKNGLFEYKVSVKPKEETPFKEIVCGKQLQKCFLI